MTSYQLSARSKNILDTLLGLGGALAGYITANATSFGQYAPEAGIAGLIFAYFVSDALTYVDTGQLPPTSTLEQQALASVQAFQKLPNLTPQEQQILNLAQGVLQAHQTPATA